MVKIRLTIAGPLEKKKYRAQCCFLWKEEKIIWDDIGMNNLAYPFIKETI